MNEETGNCFPLILQWNRNWEQKRKLSWR